jgi:hypothetical protein
MTPELQKAVAEFLNWLKASAQQGGEFVKQQVPDLLQQQLRYAWWVDVALVGFAVLGMVATLALFIYLFKSMQTAATTQYNDFDSVGWVMGMVACAITFLGSFISIMVNSMELLKITLAPKVYLLEWITGLMK